MEKNLEEFYIQIVGLWHRKMKCLILKSKNSEWTVFIYMFQIKIDCFTYAYVILYDSPQ